MPGWVWVLAAFVAGIVAYGVVDVLAGRRTITVRIGDAEVTWR